MAQRGFMERIVILTGAGLSAESGLDTFRGREGTWGKVDPAKLANPKAFARNPRGVHSFYNRRRAASSPAKRRLAYSCDLPEHHGRLFHWNR
jgi:NAD-dependent deacetylase